MNKEIKEILKKIKSVSNFDDYVDFVGTEFKPLLDYITNLEQCYCNRTDCSARIKDSKKYDSLQQRIDKAIKLLKEAGCYDEETKTFCDDIYYELPNILNALEGSDKE